MIQKKHIHRYRQALRIAKHHRSGGKFRMVCLVFKGKKLIHIAKNYYPNYVGAKHSETLFSGLGLHAEIAAMKVIKEDTRYCSSKYTFYIAGCNKNQTPIVSRPCPRCSRVLSNDDKPIKAVVYWDGQQLVHVKPSQLEILPIPKYNE